MAEGLRENNTLTELGLSQMGVGAEGITALAEVLAVNKTLTCLHVRKNKCGAQAGQALAVALQSNHTLTELHLYGNDLGPAELDKIAVHIKRNRKHYLRATSLQICAAAVLCRKTDLYVGQEGLPCYARDILYKVHSKLDTWKQVMLM